MPDTHLVILTPAWRDIDQISDLHLMLAGSNSAEEITEKLIDTISLLAEQPCLGALHPDPFLAGQQYRKLICGKYVCIYKVIDQTVYAYRIVDGRTDYPRLLR